jgi:hypothetical protein
VRMSPARVLGHRGERFAPMREVVEPSVEYCSKMKTQKHLNDGHDHPRLVQRIFDPPFERRH